MADNKELKEEAPDSNASSNPDPDPEPTRRVLARVVRLGSTVKHPNADRLNIGEVGGWKVVVGLDTNEGDAGVYFEIDSMMPMGAEWVKDLGLEKPLIKTKKIRGELSQGLFVKLDTLRKFGVFGDKTNEELLNIENITQQLGITKKPDIHQDTRWWSKKNLGSSSIKFGDVFVDGPSKTDEPRVQNEKLMLEELRGKPYYITLKIDGSSATFGLDPAGKFVVCSRNFLVTEEDSPYWKVALKHGLPEKIAANPNLVIQAEVYGPKIQKNRLNTKDFEMAVFTIFDKKIGERLSFQKLCETCETLNLPMVYVEEYRDSFEYSCAQLLEKAKGFYAGTKNHREGLVIRAQEPLRFKGEYISFKAINNDYLLKEADSS